MQQFIKRKLRSRGAPVATDGPAGRAGRRCLTATAGLIAASALLLAGAREASLAEAAVVWDNTTLVQVTPGGAYARMQRLPDSAIICCYERHPYVCVNFSRDNGRTWGGEVKVATTPSGGAFNPEMLLLPDGELLLFYNERPDDGIHCFSIHAAASSDNGKTWEPRPVPFRAGTRSEVGCWEPAAIQLPSGEIQLFFASEYPYQKTDEQEITLMRSFDSGRTWTEPKAISFRAGRRDGMPSPLLLADGKGIVVAIEDNGYTLMFTPSIVWTSLKDNWKQKAASGASPRRWRAIDKPTTVEWGGAPCIRQMPSGRTVLSFQSSVGRDWPQMVVYVGDSEARHFVGRSVPFDVPAAEGGWWNSLFVKDSDTLTAISGFKGGIWAVDGKVVER